MTISAFDAFVAGLPADRQQPVREVWEALRAAMPSGYTEQVGPKFLQYGVAGEGYVALANMKNYISLYLMPLYVFAGQHREQLQAAAPGLKFGKSCLNFTRAAQLPLAAITQLVAAHRPEDFLAQLAINRSTPRAC